MKCNERKLSLSAGTVLWLCGHAFSECGTQGTLKGKTWKATEILGQGVLHGTEVTASFNEDGTFNAAAGCNFYESGLFLADGSSINIRQDFEVNRVQCQEEIMNQEDAYISALRLATVYKIHCNNIELLDENGAILVAFSATEEEHFSSYVSLKDTLVGTNWKCTKIKQSSVLEGTIVTAHFEVDGKLNGHSGCNLYKGEYKVVDNSTFHVKGDIFVSRKHCPKVIMEQEQKYLAALLEATIYQINSDILLIDDDVADSPLLTFGAHVETEESSSDVHRVNGSTLVGTNWTATKMLNTSIQPGTIVTALFDESGKISGSTGCNHYEGKYELTIKSTLLVDQNFIVTFKVCSDDVMKQEKEFLRALANATLFNIGGDVLLLGDDEKAYNLLTFVSDSVKKEPAIAVDSTSTTLVGTNWVASKIRNKLVLQGTVVTALFDENGKVSGSTGCNHYEGNYNITSNSTLLVDDDFVVTLKLCPDDIMEQEKDFLGALANATHYIISHNVLTLDSGGEDSPLLTFIVEAVTEESVVKAFGVNKSTLVETNWEATKIRSISVLQGTIVTAFFGENGQVSGSTGCNRYKGKYEVTSNSTIFVDGNFAVTFKLCSEDIMKQERTFLGALADATTYYINRDVLLLDDEKYTNILTFVLGDMTVESFVGANNLPFV